MKREINIQIEGGICGRMWMPQSMGGREFQISLTAERRRFTGKVGMRFLLDSILAEHGGDFQGPRFTADTMLVVACYGIKRKRVREWSIDAFPSVADLIDKDYSTYDFGDFED